ncbi:protein takeout isoform X1 [Tribolium castaneum]|uniref:Protein takeout-like Protein n=2 Tax=Tribolium castaneum TaxID=7070 RepID=D6WLR0_TRICA|nr:PREDICTED: protein takeout [Tribolium castaneum]EFA03417.1 Protein takeout-like Protein [Tribolium castaneum]|eukprot:XP_972960.2 PREDICTED: protein takeout [Tribolium castaneum]
MFHYYVFATILCYFHTKVSGYQVKDAPLLTKRPPWLRVCRRSDPELNTCLNDLFTEMFPQLARGIPDMNVDPFEPLFLDKVTVSKGSGAITLTGGLYDLVVSGPSNSTPTYTEFDEAKKTWNFGLTLPLLSIKSQYNLKGKILVLPLVGHGACDLKLSNVQTKVTTTVDFPLREGREVVKIDKMQVDFKVGGMKVKLYNLFNGNKVLGQTVNQFINQNALEIIGELKDSIGDSLAGIFTDIMNNVFTKMPTDLWFLSDEEYEKYQKESNSK